MQHKSFHHGNLRAELLDRAELVLRDRGLDALSLRELARDAGVSHAAPRAHFVDRAALLEALAERGFLRLAEVMRGVQPGPRHPHAFALLKKAGAAYLDFAADNSALLALMLATKSTEDEGVVHAAAAEMFLVTTGLVAAAVDVDSPARAQRLTRVLSATLQGISAQLGQGLVTRVGADALLDDALRVFLAGADAVAPLGQSTRVE